MADRTFADAAAMARANVAVIISSGADVPLEAALAASPTIPIVMLASNYDPIARGYVVSLARPGGHVTGFFYRQPELTQKRVELLVEAFPGMRRLAVLWDENSSESFTAAEHTAKGLALDLHSVKLEHPPYDFEDAFARVTESQPQMLLVLSSRFFAPYRARIAELAIKHRLPAMFIFRAYAAAGGLMYYGVDAIPMWRRAADYVSKILRGASPADLPVEQARRSNWSSISRPPRLWCPYGPHNLMEWNHCQPTWVKIILADNPLRDTVTADGPISLEDMFEVGNSLIAASGTVRVSTLDTPEHSFKRLQARRLSLGTGKLSAYRWGRCLAEAHPGDLP